MTLFFISSMFVSDKENYLDKWQESLLKLFISAHYHFTYLRLICGLSSNDLAHFRIFSVT